MCGINGIVAHGQSPERSRVERMNERLAHRGPDGAGVVAFEDAVLGHRRLAIIDLSDAGIQPMRSACGRYHIVFNGEIYNFGALRSQLSDYPFQTGTDTEVLLAAFARWGSDCLPRLHGMFAFALWDEQERALFLARDRLGIKPLYYHASDGGLAFSSELRALIAGGTFEPQLDRAALVDYLRYQTVHAPATILAGVRMLMPGCVLRFDGGLPSIKTYWSPADRFDPTVAESPIARIHGEVRRRLCASVEERLIADVPLGAFLSGGIDSSAIVAIMAAELGQRPQTFCVTFGDDALSEAPYARLVAERYGTEHHEIQLSPERFLELVPEAMAAMDHPSGDGPNTYVVAGATKRAGITVALSGLGGDELFAGYSIFRRAAALPMLGPLSAVPLGLRSQLGRALCRLSKGRAADKVAALLSLPSTELAQAYPLARRLLFDDGVAALLSNPALPPDRVAEQMPALIGRMSAGARFPRLSRVSLCELTTYMQNVLLRDTDQMTMAHALEVRVPFLDHRLVEYALNVGDLAKFPRTPKRLLVGALSDLLPREIVDRPKMGFTLPWERWLRGPLRPFVRERVNRLAELPEFDGAHTRAYLQRFEGGDPRVLWSSIWALATLGDWLERHLPAA